MGLQEAMELERERAMLKDPNVIHLNMLHGSIAKLSRAQIMHLHPEIENEIKALQAAIQWALGAAPDHNGHWFGDGVYDREAKSKPYWWRKHLRILAGMPDLAYDKERRTIVDRANITLVKKSKD